VRERHGKSGKRPRTQTAGPEFPVGPGSDSVAQHALDPNPFTQVVLATTGNVVHVHVSGTYVEGKNVAALDLRVLVDARAASQQCVYAGTVVPATAS
jgi:hypothetical protein